MQVVNYSKSLSEERFLEIYQSLEQKGFGPLDGEVAQALKFRPQAIRKLPMQQRARRAKSLLERGGLAELCYELFGAYLMKNAKQLVLDFLDKTGVKHEEGMVEDLDSNLPDADKIEGVIAELDKTYDPRDVSMYLSICAEQWPQSEPLQRLFEERVAASDAR